MGSITIATSVDPCQSPHTRLHEVIMALAKQNEVTVISIHETQRGLLPDGSRYSESSKKYLKDVEEIHITRSRIPMALQESLGALFLRKMKPKLGQPEIIVDYNTISLGLSLQRLLWRTGTGKRAARLYDLADYLPDLLPRALPPVPGLIPAASAVSRMALKHTVRLADRVSTTLPLLALNFGADPRKVIHIPNGVDVSMFRPASRSQARKELGIPNERLLIGYVGTLREWVSLDVVLEALSLVEANEDEIPLLMVAGREGAFEMMRDHARSLGVSALLRPLGTIPYHEVPRFLTACDLTVVPFKRGRAGDFAMPLKILEAFACGTPVACPSLKGILMTFGDTIIRCDSVQDYARTFMDLCADPTSFRSRGLAGHKLVTSLYDWNRVLEPLIRYIEERVSS